ncbi:MAG TPA: replication-associated recombination protein A [Candidatus Binatia bacterium]|jgi:putative ATPase|nr:replication-associated recombination protein A [Candidatus Binatia bacterium]
MARQPELFPRAQAPAARSAHAPLAERMRPRTVEEFIGQQHLLGPGRVLRDLLAGGRLESLILWGPPGTGKTTLAKLLGAASGARSASFSAVLHGVKELRAIVQEAGDELARTGQPTVLFVDEIHRLNKAQQDAFLPHVEAGTIILVGATTENPSFEVIPALISRTRVLVLEPLTDADLGTLVDRALADAERGLGADRLEITAEAREFLVGHGQGDARVVLGALELAARIARARKTHALDLPLLEEAAQQRALRYDKGGEEHYNVISAFIKSMRGGDPDAAVYWVMRMLEAGEDPLLIARRMVIFAAEDIGNADPQALQVAIAVRDAVHFVGLPEGRIPLAQAATFLATCPKSNAAYVAMQAASEDVRRTGALPVPLHIRNAPTPLMKGLGYGAGYEYPHDHPDAVVEQDYLPEALAGRRYYEPTDRGREREIGERLRTWRSRTPTRPPR